MERFRDESHDFASHCNATDSVRFADSPLAKEHLMDEQYIPVGPLMPLRTLVGPGPQQ